MRPTSVRRESIAPKVQRGEYRKRNDSEGEEEPGFAEIASTDDKTWDYSHYNIW